MCNLLFIIILTQVNVFPLLIIEFDFIKLNQLQKLNHLNYQNSDSIILLN